MTIRILCDENVEAGAVAELEARGFAAEHVTDHPGASADDERVASYARERDAVLVTNDTDFLDESRFPEVRVFYYPENRLAGHEVADRVEAVHEIVTAVDDLPRTLFLSREYDW